MQSKVSQTCSARVWPSHRTVTSTFTKTWCVKCRVRPRSAILCFSLVGKILRESISRFIKFVALRGVSDLCGGFTPFASSLLVASTWVDVPVSIWNYPRLADFFFFGGGGAINFLLRSSRSFFFCVHIKIRKRDCIMKRELRWTCERALRINAWDPSTDGAIPHNNQWASWADSNTTTNNWKTCHLQHSLVVHHGGAAWGDLSESSLRSTQPLSLDWRLKIAPHVELMVIWGIWNWSFVDSSHSVFGSQCVLDAMCSGYSYFDITFRMHPNIPRLLYLVFLYLITPKANQNLYQI